MRVRKGRLSATCFTVLLLVSTIMGRTMFTPMAKEEEGRTTPYYKSVRIQEGGNLWGIVRQCREGSSTSMGEYVNQLRQTDGLKKDITHTRQYLIAVYFE